MKLLTKAIEAKLPKHGDGDGTAYVKFFTPWTNWTWYGCEAEAIIELEDGMCESVSLGDIKDGAYEGWRAKKRVEMRNPRNDRWATVTLVDIHFFGYVEGFSSEWGYFSLTELASVKGPFGLKIERDLHWIPAKVVVRG